MSRFFTMFCCVLMVTSFAFGQSKERVIDWLSQSQPTILAGNKTEKLVSSQSKGIELIEIKVSGSPIVLGKTFIADADWLKYLTVKVKNVSDKPILSVGVGFMIPESKISFYLSYQEAIGVRVDKNLMPGEEAELSRNDEHYKKDSERITSKIGNSEINKVLIGVTRVEFANGSVWIGDKLQSANQTALK